MSQTNKFVAFMDGLKSAIRQQIVPHVSTLAKAQIMAGKIDLHASQGSRHDKSAGNGFGSQKSKFGKKNKGKGHVGMVEGGS